MGVFRDQEQRPAGGRLGQQVEDRQGDTEVLRRVLIADAEGRVEHGPVNWRELSRVRAHRTQQLLQAREREPGLGLHSPCRQHAHVPLPGERHRLSEQAGLADSRFPAQHQRRTGPLDCV